MYSVIPYNTNMDTDKFKQRSLNETLTLLCKAEGGSLVRAGRINQSAVARKAGVSQANISRWLSGDYDPRGEGINKLAKAFGVTPAQMRGEHPIAKLDGVGPTTDLDRQFFESYKRVPDWLKQSWIDQAAAYIESQNKNRSSDE